MKQSTQKHYGSIRGSLSVRPMTQKYDTGLAMNKEEIAQSRAKHFRLEKLDKQVRDGSVNIGTKGSNMFAIATCYNKKDVIRARQKEMREIAQAKKDAKNG